MKLFSSATRFSVLLASVGMLTLGGCATFNKSASDKVLVCPQCKMVATTIQRPKLGFEYSGSYGSEDMSKVTETVYRDKCPGCQGVIKTLFVNGKSKYQCTICEDSPFSCPVSHLDGI